MPTEHEQIQQWAAANPWFSSNPALAQAAIGIEAHLNSFGVPLQERLAHTTRTLAQGLGGPEYQDARRAYAEIARVDRKFAERFSEDQYVSAAMARR